MCNQCAFIRGCIVTLVAFVRLFSTVSFQMGPQFTCIGSCKVTLVAFVCLLTTMCFQMWPQGTCKRGSIVALIAFIRLFPTMSPHMSSDLDCMFGWIAALVAFVDFRPGHRLSLWIFHFPFNIWKKDLSLVLCPFTPCLWMRQRENALKERRPWKWKYSLSQPTFSAKIYAFQSLTNCWICQAFSFCWPAWPIFSADRSS